MFELRKLTVDHLKAMAEEPQNEHIGGWFKSGTAQAWAQVPNAFSGFVRDQLVISGGFTKYWEGRAHVWTVFSSQAEGCFISVFRGMQRVLEQSPYRRIEIDVPLGTKFTEIAQRRAIMLGFELECVRAKQYRPSGLDAALYAWTRRSNVI